MLYTANSKHPSNDDVFTVHVRAKHGGMDRKSQS